MESKMTRWLVLWAGAALLVLSVTPGALAKKPPNDPPPVEPPVKYKMVEIELNDGLGWNNAEGINNYGIVVGHGSPGPTWICSFDENGNPVLQYLRDLIIDIPGDGIDVDPSWDWNRAGLYGINDTGQLCGYAYQTRDGFTQARAFRCDPGFDAEGNFGYQPLALGTLDPDDSPETFSHAFDINESGDVTGISRQFAGDDNHAFLWRNDTGMMTGVPDFGGYGSRGLAVNNLAQVCGYADLPSDRGYKEHAFRYTPPNVLEDLGTIKTGPRGNETSSGQDINDDGWVVGCWALDAGRVYSFLDIPGVGMMDLGEWGGNGPRGINNHGDICGCAFLWTMEHGMIDLESTIENLPEEYKGWLYIQKINDHGWICGSLNLNSGSDNPFVLIPTKSLDYWQN